MAWHDDTKHPFAGIPEKLKRADENIVNLHTEISLFIQSGKYPVIPHPNDQMFKEAVSYHRNKEIPRRFGVLVGETVHHLRSSLDHIIWHFANSSGRDTGVIEFPIFDSEPVKEKEIQRYERKIKGITNANVLQLIKEMQPYQIGTDVANHALLIIHNMDRFDKHRELVIIGSSVEVNFPPETGELRVKAEMYSQGKLPKPEHLALGRAAFKDYRKATPGVAFPNFGNWKTYPVIKGLAELQIALDNTIEAFASEV